MAPPTIHSPPTPLPRAKAPTTFPNNKHPLASIPRPPPHRLRNSLPLRYLINAILDEATGKLLEYRHLIKTDRKPTWLDSCSKKFARLGDGLSKDSSPGTNTMEWIHRHQIPSHKKPTYIRICAKYRPQKADPYRVHCTLGGNLIQYPDPTSSPVIKVLLNSVLSTPNAKFCSVDIKDFYLNTDLPDPEHLSVPIIIEDFKLQSKVSYGNVYARVNKGMNGLPQAGKLANDDLVAQFSKRRLLSCTIHTRPFHKQTQNHPVCSCG